MTSSARSDFRAAAASAGTWQETAAQLLQKLGQATANHRLGIFYVTPDFADNLIDIEIFMRQTTGVPHWVGTVGAGVCSTGTEYLETPAIAAMLLSLPEHAFHLLNGIHEETEEAIGESASWLGQCGVPLILTHGDPSNPLVIGLIEDLALESGGFLVGGLSAAMGRGSQIAGSVDGGGLSGVMFSDQHAPVVTSLTQGCTPIGPPHRVTDCHEDIIISIDDRPALDVFKEEIGDLLTRDLEKVAGYIYAALPVTGGERPDYMVRNLTGIDPQHGAMAIAAEFEPGDLVMFCRRDHDAAVSDMNRMLQDLEKRVGDRAIKGGIYVTCSGRGANQFGPDSEELKLISEKLGDFPLVGFFANGEINRDRLYSFTGILTLFV
ncbi:FIST signal transduction protein [Aestuariispira ectoiniformans]|uniref:FIST signal transduction protein n=1 Tax=Aestuariispira ectoiniformans TaxID=2775080 RepID=UPI00223BDD09|nr:FIST C-terminal domain-containing protein [Aestuariispira ectoiniformans]